MRQILPRAFLLTSLLLSGPALADLFGVSPYQYGLLVNEALKQVGSEIRLHRNNCIRRAGSLLKLTLCRTKPVPARFRWSPIAC
jgi:hypothetical protein